MSLQYHTIYQILEEDILNYSPTVMFVRHLVIKKINRAKFKIKQ